MPVYLTILKGTGAADAQSIVSTTDRRVIQVAADEIRRQVVDRAANRPAPKPPKEPSWGRDES